MTTGVKGMRVNASRWVCLIGIGLSMFGCVSQPAAVGVMSSGEENASVNDDSEMTRDPAFSRLVFIGGVPENTPIDPFHAHRDIVAVSVSEGTLATLGVTSASTDSAAGMSNPDTRIQSSDSHSRLAPASQPEPAMRPIPESKRRLVNIGHDFTLGDIPEALLKGTAFETISDDFGLDPWTLYALALFETGRVDPDTGMLRPHPYVIHRGGDKTYYKDRQEAEAVIDRLEANGVSNYDIGVLQINRKWHAKTVGGPKNLLNVSDSLKVVATILRRSFRASPDDYILAVGRFRGWDEAIARPFGERVWHIRKQLPNPPTLSSKSDEPTGPVVEAAVTASLF